MIWNTLNGCKVTLFYTNICLDATLFYTNICLDATLFYTNICSDATLFYTNFSSRSLSATCSMRGLGEPRLPSRGLGDALRIFRKGPLRAAKPLRRICREGTKDHEEYAQSLAVESLPRMRTLRMMVVCLFPCIVSHKQATSEKRAPSFNHILLNACCIFTFLLFKMAIFCHMSCFLHQIPVHGLSLFCNFAV